MNNSSATEMQVQASLKFSGADSNVKLKEAIDLETYEKQDIMLDMDKQSGSQKAM